MKTAVIGAIPAASSTTVPSLILPATMVSIRRRVGITAPKPKARSSGRSATFARTSSGPVLSQSRRPERPVASLAGHGRNPEGSRHHKAVVNEASTEERAALRPLPLAPFRSVLKLERRISREGMVSVGGNFYSVPDATRRRVVEVHTLAEKLRIFEDGALIATHPTLEDRHQRHVEPGHRNIHVHKRRHRLRNDEVILHGSGDRVAQRPLAFYDAVYRRTAIWLSARISTQVLGQLLRIARIRRRRWGRISAPLGRLAGRRTAPTKRPSPSNTTIGWKPYSS